MQGRKIKPSRHNRVSPCSLAYRYNNPVSELTLSPQSWTRNLATGYLNHRINKLQKPTRLPALLNLHRSFLNLKLLCLRCCVSLAALCHILHIHKKVFQLFQSFSYFLRADCVSQYYAYVTHFLFFGDVWIRTRRVAAARRCATNLPL